MTLVVPQNVIRREILAAMSAKATKRGEFEFSRALPKARNARARQGIGLRRGQCVHLKPTLAVRCGTESLAQAATRV